MLGAADMDYIAARSLMLSFIFPAGQAKAAEATEKILKLFAMCEHGMSTGQPASPRQVRAFGHGIVDLFDRVVGRLRADAEVNIHRLPFEVAVCDDSAVVRGSWCDRLGAAQVGAGSGGIQGRPVRASRMTVS